MFQESIDVKSDKYKQATLAWAVFIIFLKVNTLVLSYPTVNKRLSYYFA